jgi:DNA-binding MltR family transcriptional regulator
MDSKDERDDPIVERVAKAIYDTQVKAAREAVDKISFDASELPELFGRLQRESETAQVLIFASYLEDRVRLLIKSHLRHVSSAVVEEQIFGSNGPLSTFGSRISLSHQLGWISPTQKAKLDAFRKIRNEFAHSAFRVKLTDPSIADKLSIIDYDVRFFLTPIRETFTSKSDADPIVSDDEITSAQENLCNLALLAMRTFMDYLVLPSSIAFQVDPHDIAATFDESPVVLQELRRQVSRTVLALLGRPRIEGAA